MKARPTRQLHDSGGWTALPRDYSDRGGHRFFAPPPVEEGRPAPWCLRCGASDDAIPEECPGRRLTLAEEAALEKEASGAAPLTRGDGAAIMEIIVGRALEARDRVYGPTKNDPGDPFRAAIRERFSGLAALLEVEHTILRFELDAARALVRDLLEDAEKLRPATPRFARRARPQGSPRRAR